MRGLLQGRLRVGRRAVCDLLELVGTNVLLWGPCVCVVVGGLVESRFSCHLSFFHLGPGFRSFRFTGSLELSI